MGCAGFLTKPIKQSALLEEIRRAGGVVPTDEAALGERERSAQGLILLVEDNLNNQNLARIVLGKAGFEVAVAANGQEVLDSIPQRIPDLVLLDVQMPVVDGLTTAREIRRRPDCANLPIIAMTAHALKGDREKCLDAGMNDYLSKPIKRTNLLDTVAVWTGTPDVPQQDPDADPSSAFDAETFMLMVDNDHEAFDALIGGFVATAGENLGALEPYWRATSKPCRSLRTP